MYRIDARYITTRDERTCPNDNCESFGHSMYLIDQDKGGDPEIETWRCSYCGSIFKMVKFMPRTFDV